MSCVHLKKLYHLCQQEGLKLSGPDLIHIVCEQCGEQEVCPSVLYDEYEAHEKKAGQREAGRPAGDVGEDKASTAATKFDA